MKRLWLLLAFQLAVVLGWAGYQEWQWQVLPTVRLELGPVDPIDPLRGRYFRLNPKIESLEPALIRPFCRELAEAQAAPKLETNGNVPQDFLWNGPAWVICAAQPDGILRPVRLARLKPARLENGQTALFLKRVSLQGEVMNADMGLDRFYLPARVLLPGRENETGWSVEVMLRRDGTCIPKALWFRDKRVVKRS